MGQITLSKNDFIERVSVSAKRYKETFDQTQLDEWIKQDLTFAGERGPNIGRRPTYTYGCRHYRRTLQLVRFYSAGIRDRDEILVQLFIRNYGVKPHEIREALNVEYRKARDKLNAPVRSIFADQEREIPLGRKTQLKRQLGPLDKSLDDAGFIIPDELLFSLVRTTRNSDSQALHSTLAKLFPAEAKVMLGNLNSVFAGLLAKDEENESEVERLIRTSSENKYEIGKNIFNGIRAMFRVALTAAENNSPEKIAYSGLHPVPKTPSLV